MSLDAKIRQEPILIEPKFGSNFRVQDPVYMGGRHAIGRIQARDGGAIVGFLRFIFHSDGNPFVSLLLDAS